MNLGYDVAMREKAEKMTQGVRVAGSGAHDLHDSHDLHDVGDSHDSGTWFAKKKATGDGTTKKTLGEGMFRLCKACGETQRDDVLRAHHEVCPTCGFHGYLEVAQWRALLLDAGSWVALDGGLTSDDPLGFTDSKAYAQRIADTVKKTGAHDAFVFGRGTLSAHAVWLGCFDFRFMGGSMGSVVGEKITRMMEQGAAAREPVILLSCSGGARMQEGPLSLMQMAKSVLALGRLRDAGVPFISVLLNPTTGGVAASFALLGDVNIAEPGALIGFAGPRVIEDTIRAKLPEGFQRAEFLLAHGMIDQIVPRPELRRVLTQLLGHLLGP